LHRASELPDAEPIKSSSSSESNTKPFFPRYIVLSNRSASLFLKLEGHRDKALDDGNKAERLDPTHVKGTFRKGLALHAMGRYRDAIESLSSALKLEPKNKQIKQSLQFAEVHMTQEMRKMREG
jgi:tetratricopeptide (TPR) repeat protein